MKTVYSLLLLISLSSCSSAVLDKTGLEGNPLPTFNLFLADSITHFNTNYIPAGQPIILFYFGPQCPYSRAQIQDLINNMSSFEKVRFYIFTTSSFQELKNFYTEYQLEKYKNITVGVDYTNFFGSYFKVPGVPYLAIYDGNKRLKLAIPGKTDIKRLRELVFH